MAMKTYITRYCPHCNRSVEYTIERGTNHFVKIGMPIIMCPYCNMPFKKSDVNEWLFLSQKDRNEYLCFGEKGSDRMGMWIFIIIDVILFIVSITSSVNGNYSIWFGFLGAFIISLFFVIPHIIKLNSNKDKKYNDIIKVSLIRCCDEDYLRVLKMSGYEIVPIDEIELVNNDLKLKYEDILEKWKSIDTSSDLMREEDKKSATV